MPGIQYSIPEQVTFFDPAIINPYRNILYALPQNLMLKWTFAYAAYLKATEPAIHRNRSIDAIAIHIIYADNLLHGSQRRIVNKDSAYSGSSTRIPSHPQGLNPLTYKYRLFLM
ncbi:hypothetical protein ACIQ6U_09485 [Lysinibacillus fusiformis]|uniref:hypothetical protein n=1 Tax=Lysinibacillus fusiformis TaxID=28031 RepID=UPI00382D6691